MNDSAKQIAGSLLQIKAIKLNPTNHFTWASGWYSPIYCDNRKILSYPAVRKQVYEAFAALIAEKYPQAEVLAGVATGAIAHGALVAEKMGKPFIYVRSAPKSHGLTNQVEGEVKPGAKVVVIEDLVSTVALAPSKRYRKPAAKCSAWWRFSLTASPPPRRISPRRACGSIR